MVSSLAIHFKIDTTDSNPSDSTRKGLDLVAKVGIYWHLKCLRKTQAPHDQEMEIKITCVTYNISRHILES